MVVTQAPPAAPTAPVTRRGWRAYPPVESPLSLSTIVSAVSRAARAPARARSQLMALLCERFGARRALLYASGTDALTEAIRIACTGRPPTVALPAFACYDLVTAAVGADARVLFYDIDPTTLQPEWDSFRAAVRSGPAAVVVASLFGFPIDWDAVASATAGGDTVVIEDAAQAAGATWADRPVGSYGDLTVLSFGRGKGWTGGGGGALLSRADHLHLPDEGLEPTGSLGPLAKALAQTLLSNPRVYRLPASLPWLGLGVTRYKEPRPPGGMSDFSTALALANADESARAAGARRTRAAEYDALLDDVPGCTIPTPDRRGLAGYLRYPVLFETGEARDRLADAHRLDGVAASYPMPLPQLALMLRRTVIPDGARHDHGSPPGAARLARCLLTLPVYPGAAPGLAGRLVASITGSLCTK
jgi:perosamine synthetase